MAHAIATDARALVRRIKPEKRLPRQKTRDYDVPGERAQLTKVVDTILKLTTTSVKPARLKNSWALLRRPFFTQAALLLIAVAVLAIAAPPGMQTLRLAIQKSMSQTVILRKHRDQQLRKGLPGYKPSEHSHK